MIGILAAMPEEIHSLMSALESSRVERVGLRDYHLGRLHGVDCVMVYSRIGKVAAASTATQLIDRFKVSEVLFTGLAGGVGLNVHRGDIVVGNELIQHDLDASPLFPQHEVPLLGVTRFKTDPSKTERLLRAAQSYAALRGVQVHSGLIASGDRFFSSAEAVTRLRNALPDTLCVEMEGAAVAQICHEHQVPFSIVRTISDSANEDAASDFPKFLTEVAGPYALAMIGSSIRAIQAGSC
jgi:adenosylhomocysteine nucleosidase